MQNVSRATSYPTGDAQSSGRGRHAVLPLLWHRQQISPFSDNRSVENDSFNHNKDENFAKGFQTEILTSAE
jgi:hypothetical protein